ncbi:hypothetical protein, partial [Bacillus rhizoplanae]|uniref:hypothetical protein n=1 Tax=Bacillus rhizoplanae TaxID=2880966 RepID=UPI003D229E38
MKNLYKMDKRVVHLIVTTLISFPQFIFAGVSFYPAILGAVRPSPQDSERSEEDRWGITAGMRPIGSTNHQWEGRKPPLMEVSLY